MKNLIYGIAVGLGVVVIGPPIIKALCPATSTNALCADVNANGQYFWIAAPIAAFLATGSIMGGIGGAAAALGYSLEQLGKSL
jgi:hypothetical protein